MSDTQKNWTPGPWLIQSGFWTVYEANEGVTNAIAAPLSARNSPGSHVEDNEQVANARLIAAAPELYEALEAAMDYIDENPCDPDIYPDQWKAWERLQKIDARAVLAKAKGEDKS